MCLRLIEPPSTTLSRPRRDLLRLGLRRARLVSGRRARLWSMWRGDWKKAPISFLELRRSKHVPTVLRPLDRVFFHRTLKRDAFPKGLKSHNALNPASGPATPAEARARLEGAFARFDQECRRRAASGQHVVSTGFGRVSVEDLVRFNAIHTRHHCKQLPGAT